MWSVTLCLLPAAAWGVFVFGMPALLVLGASVLSAVACEAVAARVARRSTLLDGSAVLCGLLVGMTMPPAVPLLVPIVASGFAMVVVKWSFGGLGGNWMNPALAGRVFAAFSWPGVMASWVAPRTLAVLDGSTAATPLELIKAAQHGAPNGPIALLRGAGYPVSPFDAGVTDWLNAYLLGPFGANMPSGYVDLFVGNMAGSIGGGSALLLLLGAVVLFARRIITWHIPTAYLCSFAVFTWMFGGVASGAGYFSGDVLFSLFTGGLLLAAFFMATDPVTTPLTRGGMVVFGAGAGIMTFILRTFGQFPESIALAIIAMNVAVPFIDRTLRPHRFGISRRSRAQRRPPEVTQEVRNVS
jgi:Na+-translocating ferredoxin:NAD+ oxidoreductase subunit D